MTQQSPGDLVLTQDHGRVRILTLNRPDRLNALNDDLLAALLHTAQAAAADDAIHAVILTGAGRAFCAGADLAEMDKSATAPASDTPKRAKLLFDDLQATLESFPKPLIAAVNGLGVGFGFTVLGYCDFTFVAPEVRLRTPFAQLGLSPEASSSYLFPLRMGWAAASRALMLGDWFSAEDVVACGLAQAVVEADRLMEAALDLATRLADNPLESLAATKALMLEAHLPSTRSARELEAQSMRRLIGGPANRAALAAFAARKAAN